MRNAAGELKWPDVPELGRNEQALLFADPDINSAAIGLNVSHHSGYSAEAALLEWPLAHWPDGGGLGWGRPRNGTREP